jgi:uncharacterized paraquat-inducible protein A
MLIDCPECQGKCSDKALICPKCGHPLTLEDAQTLYYSRKNWALLGVFLAFLLFLLAAIFPSAAQRYSWGLSCGFIFIASLLWFMFARIALMLSRR